MNTEQLDRGTPPKPTGRRYSSVKDLMAREGVPQEVQDRVNEIREETRVVLQLARLRQSAGLSQEDLAKFLKVTQSAVSKLESGSDEDLTLGQIREYARATGQRIGVLCGKPFTHVEAVNAHALGIKQHLEALAVIANCHEELEKDIQGFFGQAFFTLLKIMQQCGGKLPGQKPDSEVRIELIKQETQPQRQPSMEAAAR